MCIWVVHEYEDHGTISINRERGRGRGKRGGKEEETDSWTDKEMGRKYGWSEGRRVGVM